MTGPAVISIILLASIAIVALVGLWHERRRCIDLEMELGHCERLLKRYRRHCAGIDRLLADVKAKNVGRGL